MLLASYATIVGRGKFTPFYNFTDIITRALYHRRHRQAIADCACALHEVVSALDCSDEQVGAYETSRQGRKPLATLQPHILHALSCQPKQPYSSHRDRMSQGYHHGGSNISCKTSANACSPPTFPSSLAHHRHSFDHQHRPVDPSQLTESNTVTWIFGTNLAVQKASNSIAERQRLQHPTIHPSEGVASLR